MVQFPRLEKLARTKTVATVGPASADKAMLKFLIDEGVDVFRLNMAHGLRDEHQTAVNNIREASEELDWPVGILIDLAGPKIRLGELHTDPIFLEPGSQVSFVRGEPQNARQLTCTYNDLVDEVAIGNDIILSDGLVRLKVTSVEDEVAVCIVMDGGEIRSRQGVNLPDVKLKAKAMGDADRANALWAAEIQADFVSLSFVRTADEIVGLRNMLQEHNCNATVIAKIEKNEALKNLDSIVEASDAIMVARGDLGVEIRIEKTPIAQKQIIEVCQRLGKPVIVATQMLESMHHNRQPTRAEATDVANAILDGADACMLSGETAIGKYPGDAVAMMHRIMRETEPLMAGKPSWSTEDSRLSKQSVTDAVVFGAAQIAKRIDAKVVVIATATGEAALVKSKQRDFIPTIAITDRADIARKMSLFWGVSPVICDRLKDERPLIELINEWAKGDAALAPGDYVVIVMDTAGWPGIHDSVVVAKIGHESDS